MTSRWISDLADRWFGTSSVKQARKLDPRRRVRFEVEQLEDRIAPAGLTPGSPGFGFVAPVSSTTGPALEQTEAVTHDSQGNIYITGFFSGTANFDSATTHAGDPQVLVTAASQSIFVASYDSTGAFRWAEVIAPAANAAPPAMAIASDGTNIYVTGGTDSANGTQIFVSKLDGSGNILWTQNYGNSGEDQTYGIAANASGVFLTGYFNGTVNFNPSSPSTAANTLTSTTNPNGIFGLLAPETPGNGFVLKLNGDGSFGWVKGFISNAIVTGDALVLDAASGTVDVAGDYVGDNGSKHHHGTPDPVTVTLGSFTFNNPNSDGGDGDAFVAKLDMSTGNVETAVDVVTTGSGETPVTFPVGIAVDSAGNDYVTGQLGGPVAPFSGATTSIFTNSSGNITLTSQGSYGNIFIAKLDADGTNWDWAQAYSSGNNATNDELGYGITVGDDGDVYVTGRITGPVTFNTPTPTTLTPSGTASAFVLKMNTSGNAIWAVTAAASASSVYWGYGIDVDTNSGHIYVVGVFLDQVDFNMDGFLNSNDPKSTSSVDNGFLWELTEPPIFNPPPITTNDDYTLQYDTVSGDIQLIDNTQGNSLVAANPLAGTTGIFIDGTTGTKTLTINVDSFTSADFGGTITYNGSGTDTVVLNSSESQANLDFANPHNGSVTLDGLQINYTGLAPLNLSTPNLNEVTLNYKDANDNISISSSGGVTTVSDPGNAEYVTFKTLGPTGSINIDGGKGNNSLNYQGPISNYNSTLGTITASGGATVDFSHFASVTVPPPSISINPQFGDGSASDYLNFPNQRSMVTQLVIAFNNVVTLDTGAITVQNLDTGNFETGLNINNVTTTGASVVTITFTGDANDPDTGGSVADGNYQLVVHGSLVTNASADHQTMASNLIDNFWRLFGDLLGNCFVNNGDATLVAPAYLTQYGQPGYVAALDYYNANDPAEGFINNGDTSEFSQNYLKILEPPAQAPSTPVLNPAITTVSHQITLSWIASTGPAGSNITYNLYESTTAGGEGLTPVASGLTGTTLTLSSVPSGTYYFTVVASSQYGESLPSNEIQATVAALSSPPMTEGMQAAETADREQAPTNAETGEATSLAAQVDDGCGSSGQDANVANDEATDYFAVFVHGPNEPDATAALEHVSCDNRDRFFAALAEGSEWVGRETNSADWSPDRVCSAGW